MGDEIEVDKVTVFCGSVLLSSPRSDSCVGMGDEIEVGKAGESCGGASPVSFQSNLNYDHINDKNNCAIVESHETTDSDTSANEASNDSSLEAIKAKNHKGLNIAYININSIRNKLEFLKPLIADNVDVLAIAETKIDETFTTGQFLLDGFSKPVRFDRNQHGGGLLIYVREGVPFKEISVYKTPNDIECGIIEVTLKKQKWLLFCIYRPPAQSERYFFDEIGKGLDFYSSKYESFCLIGDFNCEPITMIYLIWSRAQPVFGLTALDVLI